MEIVSVGPNYWWVHQARPVVWCIGASTGGKFSWSSLDTKVAQCWQQSGWLVVEPPMNRWLELRLGSVANHPHPLIIVEYLSKNNFASSWESGLWFAPVE